jgi:transposase InsO family protein
VKYAFIVQHQQTWPVTMMCEVFEVSRSGFYLYEHRQHTSSREQTEGALVARVKAIHTETRQSYGSRRMAKQLQAEGYAVGRAKARRLMQEAGVAVKRTQRFVVTTDSRHRFPIAPNLVARQFDVMCPNQVWGTDITYLWTTEGWLYVAVVMDLFSRKIVGWAMSEHIDAVLVQQALVMALGRRQPSVGLIHHSDRGSQYACTAYQHLLAQYGIRGSMSRKGDCLDNAVVERFFGSLKHEWTGHCQYATRHEAKCDVIAYIDMFYNSTRQHSYLGYLSPNDYEAAAKGA